MEIPLQASSSDGVLLDVRVERSQWTTFKDHMGEARIPLRQIFHLDTTQYRVTVDFHSKVAYSWVAHAVLVLLTRCLQCPSFGCLVSPCRRSCCLPFCPPPLPPFRPALDNAQVEQYFRLPAALAGDDGSTTIFSDFRAVGVKTHVQVLRVPPPAPNGQLPPADVVEEVLFDGWVQSTNAVEYAYAAPISDEMMQAFFEEEKLQYR